MRKLEKKLFDLVVSCDIPGIKETLQKGANPNIVNNKTEKITPLMIAASLNNVAAIRLLLCYGANRDLEDFLGRDAYNFAEKYTSKAALIALITYTGKK